MTSVEFEQFLSSRPTDAPCIRDLILDYFASQCAGDDRQSHIATKAYTDALYSRLVQRQKIGSTSDDHGS
jgi:hypothetical protein